jgi:outer membrane protein insertion porin family
MSFGIPISEYNSISTSIGYQKTELSEDGFFASQVRDFINKEGNKFDLIRLSAGFAYDTRDEVIFPNRGLYHQIVGEITVPTFGNPIEFYKLSYRTQWFHPLPRDFIFALKGEIGYGDGFLGNDDLPFFENFYGGGPRSVRGYRQNSLGPRDNFGNPLGGNIKVATGAEIIIPIPFLEEFDQFRFSGFVDAGNVYCTGNAISSIDGRPLCSDDNHFDIGELRYSAGLGAVWISPMGVMSFSLSKPFNNDARDATESFQFNIGTSF